jgi:hypothetical protein
MQTFHHLKKNSSMLHTWEGLLLQQASPNFGTYRQVSTLKLGEALGSSSPSQCFFCLRNFAKFRPEKYDLDLYKGFFSLEKWPKFARFIIKKFPISGVLWQLSEGSQRKKISKKNSYFRIYYVTKFG